MNSLASLVISATTIAVGCSDDDEAIVVDDDDDQAPPTDDDDGFFELTANIAGQGEYSFVSGIGRVQLEAPALFSVEVEIRSDTPGAVRPWHVHFGTCATGGAIVGPHESYRPLLISASGTERVSTQIAASLDRTDDMPYHIDVHLSVDDPTIIACGDIR